MPSTEVTSIDVTYVRRDPPKNGTSATLHRVSDGPIANVKRFALERDEIVLPVQVTFGILLTHGCEFDNSPNADVLVALARPLGVVPLDAQDAIRAGRNKRVFPLPENDDPHFAESYIDFTRITSLKPDQVTHLERILSPSKELLSALYTAIAVYFFRLKLDPALQAEAVARAIEEADRPF